MNRVWIMGLMLLLLCTGCTTEAEGALKTEGSKNELQGITERNGLKQLNMELLKEKINKKETFVIMVTQSTCVYCNNMKRSVVPYIKEHPDVPLYELEVDMLGTKVSDIEANFTQLGKLVTEYSGSTPELIYMKEGKVRKQQDGDMDETAFQNFLVDCGLAAENKRVIREEDTGLSESRYLKEVSMMECAEKIDNEEDFILYIAEHNRYNVMLSKKLAGYLEKKKQIVYVLNLTTMKEPEEEKEIEKLNKASGKVSDTVATFQYTPSLFKIKAGKKTDELFDNVTEEELKEWFER